MEQKIVTLQIRGEYISGAGVSIGAVGSHDDVLLEMDFRNSRAWDGTSKRAIFSNALGEDRTTIILTANLLAERQDDVYLVPVPYEAKTVAGEAFLTVEGFIGEGEAEKVRIVTEEAKFRVLPSKLYTNDNPSLTPSELEQIQAEIDHLRNTAVSASKVGLDPVEGLNAENVQEGMEEFSEKLNRWEKEITGSVVNVPIDPEPTEGSNFVPSSGGTWSAIQNRAPGGFGLGKETPKEVESADEALASGWYVVSGEEKSLLLVESMDDGNKKQTMHRFGKKSVQRTLAGGTWSAWASTDEYEVGDIRYSVKAGLGEEWMLCNGDLALIKDYPLLEQAFVQGADVNAEFYEEKAFPVESLYQTYALYGFENGTAFFMHNEYAEEGLSRVSVLENGEWTTHELVGFPDVKNVGKGKFRYTGGKYVYIPQSGDITGTSGQTIYLSNDLITWETKVLSISESKSGYTMKDIAIAPSGQVFVFASKGASSSYTANFLYGTSIDATIASVGEKATVAAIATGGSCSYAEGKFFSNYGTTSSSNHIVSFDIATETFATSASVGKDATLIATNAACVDGVYYIAVGTAFCKSTDAVTWETTVIEPVDGKDEFSVMGVFGLAGKPVAAICSYSSNATLNKIQLVDLETFTAKQSTSAFERMTGAFRIAIEESGLKLVAYTSSSASVGSSTVYTKTLSVRVYDTLRAARLPTIAADSVYAYLKGKEVSV